MALKRFDVTISVYIGVHLRLILHRCIVQEISLALTRQRTDASVRLCVAEITVLHRGEAAEHEGSHQEMLMSAR